MRPFAHIRRCLAGVLFMPLSDCSKVEISFNFKKEMPGQQATDNLCCARRAAGSNRSELIQRCSCFARLAMLHTESAPWRWLVVKPSRFIWAQMDWQTTSKLDRHQTARPRTG